MQTVVIAAKNCALSSLLVKEIVSKSTVREG
jgi:hypothetical protein